MLVNSGNLETLFTAFNTAFRNGFESASSDFQSFTTRVPSGTSEEEYGWLGQFPSLRLWVGERILRGITRYGYTIKNEKYEATIELPREKIEDDQYSVFSPLFASMGEAAMDHEAELVYGLLKRGFEETCFDGQFFFDTDHPLPDGTIASNDGGGNGEPWFLVDASRMLKPIIFQDRIGGQLDRLDDPTDENVFMRDAFYYGVRKRCNVGFGIWQTAYGSRAALDQEGYKAARQAMMGYKGDEGRPLGIKPTHLICGPSLEDEALTILNAEYDDAGATNIYYNTAELVVTPWLA